MSSARARWNLSTMEAEVTSASAAPPAARPEEKAAPSRRRHEHDKPRHLVPVQPRGEPPEPSAQIRAEEPSHREILDAAAEDFRGTRLLYSDIRVALMLLNRGRYATLKQVFGVDRDQANLVSLVGALMLAESLQRGLHRLLVGPNPSLGDTALVGAAAREGLAAAAGLSTGRTSGFPPLLGLALLAGAVRPVRRWSKQTVSRGTHHVHTLFRHRYGPLIVHHGRRMAARAGVGDAPAQQA